MSPVLSTFSGASARAFGLGYNFVTGDFQHIETQTVGAGGAASITFSSIPGTYKHLQIRGIGRNGASVASGIEFNITFNSDTGSNYARHQLDGYSGSSPAAIRSIGNASQARILAGYLAAANNGSSIFTGCVIDILDYASTTKNKTVRSITGYDAGPVDYNYVGLFSGVWLNTNAITSVTMTAASNSLVQYSTFSLYGIK